ILHRTEFKTFSVQRNKRQNFRQSPELPEFTAFAKAAAADASGGLTPQIYNVLNWHGTLSRKRNSDAFKGLGEIGGRRLSPSNLQTGGIRCASF
ncbi:MAG: hypothetical protein ACT6U0_27775, partial [Shinella sp.]